MPITQTLYSVLSLNTAGGANSPAPTDTYNGTATVGTYFTGPITVAVTSTPAKVPLAATPATAAYTLRVYHAGASSDPNIILDCRNQAGQSSKIYIAPGGHFELFNGQVLIGTSGSSDFAQWYLSTASSTTTAAVSLVYT